MGRIIADTSHQDKDPKFTRRTLGKVAAGIGGLLTLGRLAPLVQSFNSNVDSNLVLQNITNLTRPIFSGTPWLDGRTAVLLAKAQAGLKEMGAKQGASATVIVGFPHAYEAERLKKDPTGRAALIQTYAKEMINVCTKILDEFIKDPESKVSNEDLTDFVLAYLTTTEIYELYDPEYTRGLLEKSIRGEKLPEGTPDNLDIAGRFSMNRIKRFRCEEIRQALLPLGNPDRYFAE